MRYACGTHSVRMSHARCPMPDPLSPTGAPQMQSMLPPDQRMGTMDVVKSLGLRGMYQGSEATLVRDVPFSLLFFPAYSNLKDLFANADGTNSKMSLLAAGCLAGGGAAGLNTPADVVKTRMQVPVYCMAKGASNKLYGRGGAGMCANKDG